MLPLRDNLPTDRFPVLTVVLIAINVVVFGWMLTLGDSDDSSPELRELGISESDQAAIEYGAIPYRLTHPGEDCGAGAADSFARRSCLAFSSRASRIARSGWSTSRSASSSDSSLA